MFSIPFRTPAHASSVVGLDLFSGHESFLQELTTDDESRLVGGFWRTITRTRRSPRTISRTDRRRRRRGS